jgi:hypothetical protein
MNIKMGDIVEIKTASEIAYALYSHQYAKPPKFGSLIRVFDLLYEIRPERLEDLVENQVMFSTFFPLQAAVNKALLSVVGNVSVPDRLADFPIFRSGTPDPNSKKVKAWWLWDGNKEWRVGTLTPEERRYPLLAVWTYPLLIERIEKRWKPENDPVWGGAV